MPTTPSRWKSWCPTRMLPIERLLEDWKWLSLCFNRVNTAMGKNPLYPFDIPPAVVRKLAFVHKVIRETARKAAADH
jgi:hypothetical protein